MNLQAIEGGDDRGTLWVFNHRPEHALRQSQKRWEQEKNRFSG